MHKAFWDIQRSHLEADPPNYESAIGLMKEIRQVSEFWLIHLLFLMQIGTSSH